MGYGDNLMATGMAKGAAARGKRIAFGDGQQIIWDHHSEEIFKDNPNIAPPGSEGAADLEWIDFYRGNRLYNRLASDGKHWKWNYNFRPIAGEIFLDDKELRAGAWAAQNERGYIIIEPNVPKFKGCAPNKDWTHIKYFKLAKRLKRAGHSVRQLKYNGAWDIEWAKPIKTLTFRQAMASLSRAKLYIGPEGGLHHAAAALGIPAVVLFGGFIPPQVTGYDFHTNLTGGATACGSITKCQHCIDAMERIGIDEVERAALYHIGVPATPVMWGG